MEARDPELKKDLDATLKARSELGAEYETALIESFLEKVEQRLDVTVDRRMRRQLAEQQMIIARGADGPAGAEGFGERFGFGIISLILAIPLSAIAAGTTGFPGLLVCWVGVVGVNAVHAARYWPWSARRSAREAASDWES